MITWKDALAKLTKDISVYLFVSRCCMRGCVPQWIGLGLALIPYISILAEINEHINVQIHGIVIKIVNKLFLFACLCRRIWAGSLDWCVLCFHHQTSLWSSITEMKNVIQISDLWIARRLQTFIPVQGLKLVEIWGLAPSHNSGIWFPIRTTW